MWPDEYPLHTININSIIFQDTTFFCRFFDKADDTLARSIEEWGLLAPPLVRQKDDQCFQIILGFQRLKVVKTLNHKEIRCFVITKENDPGNETLWKLTISELLSHGTPHVFDQSVIFNKLLHFFPHQWIIVTILPLFGLPPSSHILDRICPLMNLDHLLALAVLKDQISHQMALRLLTLSPPERLSLGTLFMAYKFSKSTQFEILEHVLDLKAIHSIPIDELLERVKKKFLPDEGKFNLPHQAQQIRKEIRSWRFPTLTTLEQRYHKAIKSLKLGAGINLKPPPFFEGNTYHMSMTFHTIDDLREKISQLNKNIRIQRKLWNEIKKSHSFQSPKSPHKY
ncbi:MAG: ParB/RepB/Spo0J family partition protein [bacterium]